MVVMPKPISPRGAGFAVLSCASLIRFLPEIEVGNGATPRREFLRIAANRERILARQCLLCSLPLIVSKPTARIQQLPLIERPHLARQFVGALAFASALVK